MDNIQVETDTPKRGNATYCYHCHSWVEFWDTIIKDNDTHLHIELICLECLGIRAKIVIEKQWLEQKHFSHS